MAADNYVRKKTWAEAMQKQTPKPQRKKVAPKKPVEATNNGGGEEAIQPVPPAPTK